MIEFEGFWGSGSISICLSIYLSTYLLIYLSIHLSIYLYIYIYIYIFMNSNMHICVSGEIWFVGCFLGPGGGGGAGHTWFGAFGGCGGDPMTMQATPGTDVLKVILGSGLGFRGLGFFCSGFRVYCRG